MNLVQYDREQGCVYVIGVDEAGRGPIAGPIVAGGVRLDMRVDLDWLEGVDDSKKLTARRRLLLEPVIRERADALWVETISAQEIDRVGIQAANTRSMITCLERLWVPGAVCLVDGFSLKDSPVAHRRLVRGDSTSAAVAAASILAKTHRDRLMQQADERWPQFGFARHSGYPTVAHTAAVRENGLCEMHRRSFRLPGTEERLGEAHLPHTR